MFCWLLGVVLGEETDELTRTYGVEVKNTNTWRSGLMLIARSPVSFGSGLRNVHELTVETDRAEDWAVVSGT